MKEKITEKGRFIRFLIAKGVKPEKARQIADDLEKDILAIEQKLELP